MANAQAGDEGRLPPCRSDVGWHWCGSRGVHATTLQRSCTERIPMHMRGAHRTAAQIDAVVTAILPQLQSWFHGFMETWHHMGELVLDAWFKNNISKPFVLSIYSVPLRGDIKRTRHCVSSSVTCCFPGVSQEFGAKLYSTCVRRRCKPDNLQIFA